MRIGKRRAPDYRRIQGCPDRISSENPVEHALAPCFAGIFIGADNAGGWGLGGMAHSPQNFSQPLVFIARDASTFSGVPTTFSVSNRMPSSTDFSAWFAS
jgi:hypothetical protein